MTANDLLSDRDFLDFCDCWARDGRCPLGLADWLRERGYDAHAEAAEWAAAEPDRYGVLDGVGGVRPFRSYEPFRSDEQGRFLWGRPSPHPEAQLLRSDVPRDVHGRLRRVASSTFPAAVADLLDGWAAARPLFYTRGQS